MDTIEAIGDGQGTTGAIGPPAGRETLRRAAAGLALGVAAAGILATAPLATAAPFTPELNFAYELAVRYWGQEPTGCSTIDREVMPHGSLGTVESEPIEGLATQLSPETAPDSAQCILWIDRTYAQPVVFSGLCALMTHEVGHLLGMQHTSDAGSVMNEHPAIPALCAAKGRQMARVLALQRREDRLQARGGPRAGTLRVRNQRALAAEERRFWSFDG